MTRLFSILAALSVSCMTFAQEAPVQKGRPNRGQGQANKADRADHAFHLDFSESVSFYSFDSDIVVVNTHVGFEATDWLDISADLPVFNNEVGTGLGDVTLTGTVGLIDGKCDFLGADTATLDGFVAFGIPLDGDFSSDNLVITVGGDAGLGWDSWDLDLGVAYSFVDGATYVPQLGGFISGNYGVASGTLAYAFNPKFSVGGKVVETWSDDSGSILTVGPVATWNINRRISLTGEVGFSVADSDLMYGTMDVCGSLGLSISF
jgi:hypothetical protein